MRRWWLIVPIVAAGCGGGAAPAITSPSPAPSAGGITVTGTLSDTVSDMPFSTFSETVPRLPAVLTLSAPGHLARTTTVTAQGQTVDLIPEGGFDLDFYRQFARGSLDGPVQSLRVLTQDSVSFYVQVEGATGFPAQEAVVFEAVARRTVPDLTGGRVRVLQWETGTASRALQAGWVIVERVDEKTNLCGRALIGVAAGHIWIDSNKNCNPGATFAHEIGHALGFTHVTRPGSMMLPEQASTNLNDAPTELERRLGAIAYRRVRGNRDVDVDP